MKLKFKLGNDDTLVLVDEHDNSQKPLASVVLQVVGLDGTMKTVLTTEFVDEFGAETNDISFETSDSEILRNNLKPLMAFLKEKIEQTKE